MAADFEATDEEFYGHKLIWEGKREGEEGRRPFMFRVTVEFPGQRHVAYSAFEVEFMGRMKDMFSDLNVVSVEARKGK